MGGGRWVGEGEPGEGGRGDLMTWTHAQSEICDWCQMVLGSSWLQHPAGWKMHALCVDQAVTYALWHKPAIETLREVQERQEPPAPPEPEPEPAREEEEPAPIDPITPAECVRRREALGVDRKTLAGWADVGDGALKMFEEGRLQLGTLYVAKLEITLDLMEAGEIDLKAEMPMDWGQGGGVSRKTAALARSAERIA